VNNEADSRIIVDDFLRQAHWDPRDKSQVLTEYYVKKETSKRGRHRNEIISEPATEEYHAGRADYVLLDSHGRPLAIIEAKKSAIEPYTAKQQALPYAKSIGAPFIFLTNGELIYFWDYQNDDARMVNSLYSRRDLERIVHQRKERKPLATISIPDYYLRQGEQRKVRDYQQEAMRALDHALELGKRRFLIELPTGTGKTDVVALYLKRLFDSGRAERVLFLVDREQLAKQALEALQDVLSEHSSYWLKPGVVKEEKEITVCLLQTMIGRYQEFTSGYFDVVIADECHRSIYGAWQTALTHFDAVHIGLTATPAAYIERNTFEFYNCKNGQPDFTYPLLEAFKKDYLVPYKFASGITVLIAEGTDEYDPEKFEREWTNADTNRKFVEEFERLAWQTYKDQAPKQRVGPGKTIVFAITKRHAARLAKIFNEMHPELNGRYAEVITSDVMNADELIRKFKREDYPQVAVSVGMLDTGFDCREVLHLLLCRKVLSPILYQQMRGRGTRTAPHIGKKYFVIYDFFGNHKYFNDSDADIFAGHGGGHGATPGGTLPKPISEKELIELGLKDEWLEAVNYIEVGPEGERVDKKQYVTNWEQVIRERVNDDHLLRKVRDIKDPEKDGLTSKEEETLAKNLNQPEMYFNEDNLRRAYKEPGGTLIDFIRRALGMIKTKSKEEVIIENFHAWLVTKKFTPEQAQYLNLLKNRGIVRGELKVADLFEPPLSILNAASLGTELFGEQGLKDVIEEMNNAVFAKAG